MIDIESDSNLIKRSVLDETVLIVNEDVIDLNSREVLVETAFIVKNPETCLRPVSNLLETVFSDRDWDSDLMNEDSLDVVLLIVNEDVVDLKDDSILDETVFRVK